MGKSDDPSPKVRPFGEETQPTPSRSLTIAGATLAVIVAASAFFISTSPDETPPLPTLPQASLATTSTTEPTASNAPSVPPLPLTRADLNDLEVGERIGQLLDSTIAVWDAVPEAHGDLVAVIGSPAGTDLIRVGNDGAILLLERPNRAESVAFDRSGQLMAYIGDSPNTDSALYVESFSIAEAYSFSWHATVPGRIAWLEHGPERLCWADLPEPESLTALSCIRGLAFGTELVAFDDYGFITIDRAGRSIERLRPDGQRVASVAGDDIVLGPSERLLVIDRGVDTTDETTFTVISRDFTDPVRLDWAPSDPAGTPIVAAWSPSVVYPEIAFLIWAEDHHQLQVYDLEGHLNHTVDLEGRVWGLEWDSTGRYLLIPGTLDTIHLLYIYDTYEERQVLTNVPFGGWVEEAELVTPTDCLDADRIVAAWSRRLPNGVTLWPAQMVVSRDAYLLPFTFVSARITGGNFDGENATWALPVFVPDAETLPTNIMAVNEAAAALGIDNTALPDINADWMEIHGALDSQYCLDSP